MQKFNQWNQSLQGQQILHWELQQINKLVTNIFGFEAVQIGLNQINFLQQNQISKHTFISLEDADLNLNNATLPFENESVDLIILPHVLEYQKHQNTHHLLREVQRVLINEGKIIISGFNPSYLWNKVPFLEPKLPKPEQYFSVNKISDWLCLLSFEVDRGCFGCYEPPISTPKWLKKWQFINTAGNRWFPSMSSVYILSATKRTFGITLVGPSWRRKTKYKKNGYSLFKKGFN